MALRPRFPLTAFIAVTGKMAERELEGSTVRFVHLSKPRFFGSPALSAMRPTGPHLLSGQDAHRLSRSSRPWPAASRSWSGLPTRRWRRSPQRRSSKPRSTSAQSRLCSAWARSDTSLIDLYQIRRGSTCVRRFRNRLARDSAADTLSRAISATWPPGPVYRQPPRRAPCGGSAPGQP